MAEIIRKPAIKVMQGKHTLYAASFTISDFQRGGSFYRVEKLDAESKDGAGFQRILDDKRAKALGKDLTNAAEKGEAFLPTSILLATEGDVDYDDVAKEIVFSTDPEKGICPFDVVDGQHRIEGLRQFAEQTPGMSEFSVAVNIAVRLNDAQKMLQFLTVNTKQKTVDTGLAQHITARFENMKGFQTLPYLPPWLQRQVDKGADLLSLSADIVSYLSNEQDSPWYGKIGRVNVPKSKQHPIQEHAFIKSLKVHVLSANNPLSRKPAETRNRMLKNYWCAVASFFVSGDGGTVVFKSTGIEFFHFVSAKVIGRCDDLKDYRVETIVDIFQQARDELGTEGYMYPGWWQTGQGASSLNRGGIAQLASELSGVIEALSIDSGEGIKL